MSWLDQRRSTARRNAKNFTHEAANKRMKEAIAQQQSSVRNAVMVDGCSVVIAKVCTHGMACSCRQTVGYTADSVAEEERPDDFGISISDNDWYGEDAHQSDDAMVFEAGDLLAGNEPTDIVEDFENQMQDRAVDTGVKCGICYRGGFSPAFSTIGKDFRSLTAYDVEDSDGYAVEQGVVPTRMVKVHDGDDHQKPYVKFQIAVPRYYKSCSMSIRNNCEILTDLPKVNYGHGLKEITNKDLDALRGGILNVFIDVDEFTHVNIIFDMGIEIKANLSEEAGALDFATLDTVGSLNVVLPSNVGYVKAGDLIFVESRNLALKVTDAPKKSLSDKTQMEWVLNCRVLQPQEPLKHAMKSRKLY